MSGSSTTKPGSDNIKSRPVGVLVIHGVGEQKRFQHLEEIALNLAKVAHNASVDIKYGNQIERHAVQQSWHESPVIVRWETTKQSWIEAHFQEVYWADFGMSATIPDWLRMLWWIISMPGVRVFCAGDGQGQETRPADLHMYDLKVPDRPNTLDRLIRRAYLWMVCSIATPLVALAKPIGMLIVRLFSLNVSVLRVLTHTLGNVMLYQDAHVFTDRLESFSEKRRVGIRRRMVQGLLNMAAQAERGELDSYYIIAHSLGTVIAFNALMECPAALPNYLSREQWESLPASLKTSGPPAPPHLNPERPPWLKPGDAIDRTAMLKKCKGFLTAGSPLDKFASLWPAIVPINTHPLNPNIRWVNIADGLDVVANSLHYFPNDPAAGNSTGGFVLENHWWRGQPWPITAHTSYFRAQKPGQPKLMNWVVGWLENENCPPPVLPQPPRHHKSYLFIWLVFLGLIIFYVMGFVVTFTLDWIFRTPWLEPQKIMQMLNLHDWVWAGIINGDLILLSSFALVLTVSIWRRCYEAGRWGKQK